MTTNLIVGVLTLVAATALQAGTLGPSCASCYGSTYTIDNLGMVASTATTETYRIQYVIGTSGYSGPPLSFIQQVAVRVTNDVLGVSLLSAPGGTAWNPAGGWAAVADSTIGGSGLSGLGCSGAGLGWVCAQDGLSAPANYGASYSWVFDIRMATNTLLETASIQANYVPWTTFGRMAPATGEVSLGGQAPEPEALSLLFGGLAVWLWSRRRARVA